MRSSMPPREANDYLPRNKVDSGMEKSPVISPSWASALRVGCHRERSGAECIIGQSFSNLPDNAPMLAGAQPIDR